MRNFTNDEAEAVQKMQGTNSSLNAIKAMLLVMDKAKTMGYKVVSQQIGRNNTASIALHEKLGFETDEYIYRNKKGNEVLIYIKPL